MCRLFFDLRILYYHFGIFNLFLVELSYDDGHGELMFATTFQKVKNERER